jgi:hypothetical protein
MFLLVILYGISGCSKNPKEKYIRICTEASTNQKQIDSCKCMAKEYDKVLNKEEFDVWTTMMERMNKEYKGIDNKLSNMQGYVDDSGINKQVLISAMMKMQPLHNAHVCGYGLR